MKLYLIRHGQTDANSKKIVYSLSDKLNKDGIKQAHVIGEKFKNVPVDIVFTSPYEQAKKTAWIIVPFDS